MTSSTRSTGTTVDAIIDQLVTALVAAGSGSRDQLKEILVSVAALAGPEPSRLDVKIANAALSEMVHAFRVFAPYRDIPKVTIFGSARTLPDDPFYGAAKEVASLIAAHGWMVVTGAGPGIMAAGTEGAGRERSFGVNIRLPFEEGVNRFIAEDPKLVEMRYFFTRKLMLVKESDGFVVLPGGFGTLDETFELLTLLQTGKSEPRPLALLDIPGGSYWAAWDRFVTDEVAGRGLVSEPDRALYRITDEPARAVGDVLGFYRNYHSRRWVGEVMVVRLKARPTVVEVESLQRDFGDITTDGVIRPTSPLRVERAGKDHLGLPRIALRFDGRSHGRLRSLIDAVNALRSAPPLPTPPPRETV